MKKNGFIATSLIYSFLILFSSLVLIIISTYVYYRRTLESYNGDILVSLNSNISNSYVTLSNKVTDSSFEYGSSLWRKTNCTIENGTKTSGNNSIRFGNYSIVTSNYGELNQSISYNPNLYSGDVYYYLSFNVFVSALFYESRGDITVSLANSEVKSLSFLTSGDAANGTYSGNTVKIDIKFINWKRYGVILKLSKSSTDCSLKVTFNPSGGTYDVFNIDDVVVTDITDMVNTVGIDKLDSVNNALTNGINNEGKLEYFEDKKSYNVNTLKKLVS